MGNQINSKTKDAQDQPSSLDYSHKIIASVLTQKQYLSITVIVNIVISEMFCELGNYAWLSTCMKVSKKVTTAFSFLGELLL